jgi:hypothetical protein
MLDLATVLKAAPMTLPEPLGAPISATTSSAVKGLPVRAIARMQITASLCQLSCDSLAIVMPSTINSIAWCLHNAQNLGDVAPCLHNSSIMIDPKLAHTYRLRRQHHTPSRHTDRRFSLALSCVSFAHAGILAQLSRLAVLLMPKDQPELAA